MKKGEGVLIKGKHPVNIPGYATGSFDVDVVMATMR